jgi:hypothetical protein
VSTITEFQFFEERNMKFGLVILAFLHTGIAEARLRDRDDWCRYERTKMYHYQRKFAKWTSRRNKCEQRQVNERSKTCYWQIKISAHHEKKLIKWQERYAHCDIHTPHALRCKENCPTVIGLPPHGKH